MVISTTFEMHRQKPSSIKNPTMGFSTSNTDGDRSGYGRIWFNQNRIDHIILVAKVSKHHNVRLGSKHLNSFEETIRDKTWILIECLNILWFVRRPCDKTGKHVSTNCNDTDELTGINDRSSSQDNIVMLQEPFYCIIMQ